MRPLKRVGVSKGKSVRSFNKAARRGKAANIAPPVMRGGWRL